MPTRNTGYLRDVDLNGETLLDNAEALTIPKNQLQDTQLLLLVHGSCMCPCSHKGEGEYIDVKQQRSKNVGDLH